jgi:hypothetical protein
VCVCETEREREREGDCRGFLTFDGVTRTQF